MKAFTRHTLFAAAGALTLSAAPALAAPDEPEADPGSRALTDADSYVRLPALQTPVRQRLGGRAPAGMLQVTLALDAPRARTRTLIDERRIWLRDAFNETLLLYASRIYRPGDVPDAEMIGDLLQDDVDRLLGEGRATVLLDTLIIHAG